MESRTFSRRTITPCVIGLLIVTLSVFIGRILYIVGTIFILRNIGYGDEQMIPFAQIRLQSSNVFIRDAAGRGLGSIGPRAASAVPDLLLVLNSDKSQAATSAAAAIGYIYAPPETGQQLDNPQVVSALISALNHRDSEVRRYAAYAISLIGPAAESAIPQLTQQITTDPTAYMAARALGDMGPAAQSSIPELTKLLTSTSVASRAESAMALSKLGSLPDETITAIERRLTDESELVRQAAQKALNALGK